MTRDELAELHYITLIPNVPSIMERGILSHTRAQQVRHDSVALEEVQDRRHAKAVPGGRRLHEYANLYICARNPMLYRRRSRHRELCVLQVSTEVLDLPGVVICSQNAASNWVRFAPSPEGLALVDRDLVFAERWTHDNAIEYMRHKSAKCAEVLVPDLVEARFIMGAYVSCEQAANDLRARGVLLSVTVDRHIFFL